MSNTEFRTKMITALEAMQKSCSDMLEAVTGRNMELPQGMDPSPSDYVDGLLHPKTWIDYGKSLHYATDGSGGVIGVKDGGGNNVPMDGRVIGLMASCGLAPADGRNTEFPQTARRMWKLWMNEPTLNEMDNTDDFIVSMDSHPGCRAPITILPGHDAVEKIEAEAYERGVQWATEKADAARDEMADFCDEMIVDLSKPSLASAFEAGLKAGREERGMAEWKWYANISAVENDNGAALVRKPEPFHDYAVTILPGHDAVERLEMEARRQGYEEGRRHGMITAMEAGPNCAIDGVEPVVAYWWCKGENISLNSTQLMEKKWSRYSTPCRVHLYPGVGPDGKRVKS